MNQHHHLAQGNLWKKKKKKPCRHLKIHSYNKRKKATMIKRLHINKHLNEWLQQTILSGCQVVSMKQYTLESNKLTIPWIQTYEGNQPIKLEIKKASNSTRTNGQCITLIHDALLLSAQHHQTGIVHLLFHLCITIILKRVR